MSNSDWTYKGKKVDELPKTCVAFCYMITNLIDNKGYIGKKLATMAKTQVRKGKKKRIRVESDWRNYWGSNLELQEDVKRLGSDNFTREILMYCESKGQASYHEARLQFENKVLIEDGWYNSFIGMRVHKRHLQPNKCRKI
jgi:hypothetical protein